MFLEFPSDYPRPDVTVWLQSPVQQDDNLESTTLYIDGQGSVTVDSYYSANFIRVPTTSQARILLSDVVIGSAGGAQMQTMSGDRASHLTINQARKSEVNDAEIFGSRSVSKIGVITPNTCLIKPAPAPATGSSSGSVADRPSIAALIQAHNDYRDNLGLSTLQSNSALNQAIAEHVLWMIGNGTIDHTGDSGSSPLERAQAAGYGGSVVGENLADGPVTVALAMAGWETNPTDLANLDDPRWTEIGVAIASRDAGGYWWGVLFGAP